MTEPQSREDAMAEAFAAQINGNVQETPAIPEVVNTPAAEATSTENVDSSLTTQIETTAPIVENPIETPAPVVSEPSKSFEEMLAERSGGKFKSWEEIESIANTPKDEFVNDKVKQINEWAKKGIDVTDREFLDLQTRDYSNMDIPEDILLEEMRLNPEYSGLSKKTLEHELDKKYNWNEWKEKEPEDLTDDDLANEEKMMRDAHQKRDWLEKYQQERLMQFQPNEEDDAKNDLQRQTVLQNFNSYVDTEIYPKVTKLSTIIDDKTGESFEYAISESDRKEYSGLMKDMAVDLSAMFDKFSYKDKNGVSQIDNQRIFQMFIKEKIHDDAVKNAYLQGKVEGAKNFVKDDLKNVNFTASSQPVVNNAPTTKEEAIGEAMRNKGVKF